MRGLGVAKGGARAEGDGGGGGGVCVCVCVCEREREIERERDRESVCEREMVIGGRKNENGERQKWRIIWSNSRTTETRWSFKNEILLTQLK